MKIAMILLAIAICYPCFVAFGYVVARALFPPLAKVVENQKRERELLMERARRVKKESRRMNTTVIVPRSAQREHAGRLSHA